MNLWNKSNILALIFLCILSIFALKDLLKPGLYTSHDGETHTARIAQYYEALKDGQIPPRFAGSFYNGFGSPIFVYIYPLPYIIGSVAHLSGFSFVDSFKFLMASGFIFSGLFSYLWLKELFASRQAAFIGAMYYMYSPYRLQLIYVRGSISELIAYTFLPLALFFITKLRKSSSIKLIAASALSISAILLSQNLVAFVALPLIVIYSVIIDANIKSLKAVKQTVLAIILAMSISAFTYVPAIFERHLVKFDQVFKLVYNSHFVTVKQLIRSPWGYGFDLPGTVNDQMSFQIGLAHIFVLLIGLIMLAVILYRKIIKKIFNIYKLPFDIRVTLVAYIIIAACLFLVIENEATKLVWKYVSFLQIIDIPWRILGLIPVLIAIVVSTVAVRIRAGIIFIFLIFALLFANRNHVRINKSLPFTDEDFLNYEGTATQLSEFTPSDRKTLSSPTFADKTLPVNTVGGWAKYSDIVSSSKKIAFKVTVISETAQLRINKFYFPGVQVKTYNEGMNSRKGYTSYSDGEIRLDSTKDTQGLIFIPLKKGTYNMEVIFGETPLRNFANLITIVSISIAVFFLIKHEKQV